MNEWLDLLKQLGLQIAPWMIVVVLVLYIFRERLNKGLNMLLDQLGMIFRGEWSYRRFERVFRLAIRAMHLYMRVVGIRAEKGREPTIPEAYVPLRLAPYQGDGTRDPATINQKSDVQISQLPLSRQNKHWFIEEIMQRHKALVVLGDPGAGKSTLLKYLISCFTKPRERKPVRDVSSRSLLAIKYPQRSRSIVPCPLYVSLRSCRTQNDTLLKDILDPETKILAGMLPSNQRKKMPPGFIERCIEKGRALLLLDGLDEVTNEEMYADVVRKINDFYLSYPENRVVVTCRIAGWRSGLNGEFVLYHALPLDRQQQHDFIARWYETAYKRNETSTLSEEKKLAELDLLRDERKLGASEEADALERLLGERERLAELATNPMLLSLICLVYHLRRDLPRGRAALYDECVQILLGVWDSVDKDLNISTPTMDEKRKILRHVAYVLHASGQKDISRQDFVSLVMSGLGISEEKAHIVVRQIEVRSWLIVERVMDRFAFSHLTFQEFFVVEYLHTEKHDAIDLATIKDWNIWREPIMLMCGQSTDPTIFIERIAAYNIALAMLCVAEANSTLLDAQRIHFLLDEALRQVREDKLALIDLLPALISLLVIKQSPYTTQIMNFMKTYFPTLDGVSQSNQIKTIASSGTRDAARLLLYLHLIMPDRWLEVLDGLLLIGDTAIEEALQWNCRGELSDAKQGEILLRSYTPEATRALWERYGLEPGQEIDKIAWAESWACRLALAENDQLMRTIPYNGSIDAEIWPYRKSQHTALAAIVQKCVQILQYACKGTRYGDMREQQEVFVSRVECIAQFDLRVQIHLLIRLEFPDLQRSAGELSHLNSEHRLAQAKVKKRSAEELSHLNRIADALGMASSSYLQPKELTITAWHALVITGGRENNENFWRIVGQWIGAIGLFGSCVLSWAGVFIFLWNVLPSWLFGWFFSGSTLVAVVQINMYLLPWIDGSQEVLRLIATKKNKLRYPITLLIMAGVCGVLGGFAVERWFHLALLPSIIIVGFGCLLCNVLYAWMSSSLTQSMLSWLEQHPRGQVVLDEFRG